MSKPKGVLTVLLAAACLLAATAGQAADADKRGAQPSKQPAKPAAESPAGSQDNAVAQGIVKSGVRDCRDRANQVINYLAANSQSGAFLFLPQQSDGSQRLASASLEVRSPQELGYVSATFAPVGAGRCDAVYDAVVYWKANCQEVAAKSFAKFKPAGVIKQNIAILDGGALARVFLMPAGAGCVSIKKEAVY